MSEVRKKMIEKLPELAQYIKVMPDNEIQSLLVESRQGKKPGEVQPAKKQKKVGIVHKEHSFEEMLAFISKEQPEMID